MRKLLQAGMRSNCERVLSSVLASLAIQHSQQAVSFGIPTSEAVSSVCMTPAALKVCSCIGVPGAM